MLDFISWIKKDGKIFFFMDKVFFSKLGRLLFADCKYYDVLGHRAIRLYYGKQGESLQGGTEYKECDFWEADRLPKEIQDLHPEDPDEFMKHWGRMWRKGVFQNVDLCYIISNAPDLWKEMSWDRLMKQNPSNYDLRDIIYWASDSYKDRACDWLMKQNPSNDSLLYLIRYAPELWKEEGFEQLMKQNPSNNDLIYLLSFALDSYKEKAREELKRRGSKLPR